MNFCYYKILIIVFITNIIYFVKASDCCFLDYDTKAKTGTEPFLFTYSSSEFDAKKIEAHFFQIYHFLARGSKYFKKVMVTVEPDHIPGNNNAFFELNKSNFVSYIKKFIKRTKFYTLSFDAITIFIEYQRDYTFKVIKIVNTENQIKEKIGLALEKHLKVPVSGINKNNILKIFRNCQFEPPLNDDEKFTDTHVFFIDENVYEEDLNFLYDSILRLRALTSHKQTFPCFNISLLSRCEMFENEIKDIKKRRNWPQIKKIVTYMKRFMKFISSLLIIFIKNKNYQNQQESMNLKNSKIMLKRSKRIFDLIKKVFHLVNFKNLQIRKKIDEFNFI